MDNPLVIQQTIEFPDLDPEDGRPRSRMRVKFMVGKNGPFYEFFPVKDFDGAAAKLVIERRADQIRALQQ